VTFTPALPAPCQGATARPHREPHGTRNGAAGSGEVTDMRIAVTAAVLLLALTACNDDGVTYNSCAEASQAGKAPLHKGDPGYSAKLDRDGDGVACDQ
jgi:hypothetical protein